MTEPRRPARARPGRELRRWIITALALGHVAVWRVVVRPMASAPAPDTGGVAPPPIAAAGPAVVWFDELAVVDRPPVAVPAGWQLVDRRAVPSAPARPRLVRAPTARPHRVRTRSS